MVKLFAREEDRPTPKAIYNWRVYSCAIVAATAAIMIGSVHLSVRISVQVNSQLSQSILRADTPLLDIVTTLLSSELQSLLLLSSKNSG